MKKSEKKQLWYNLCTVRWTSTFSGNFFFSFIFLLSFDYKIHTGHKDDNYRKGFAASTQQFDVATDLRLLHKIITLVFLCNTVICGNRMLRR